MQLLDELRRADDGTGHQLREERKVKAEVQEIPDRLYPPTFHIDDIAHRLEGEEGDAHRQDDGIDAEDIGPYQHIQPFAEDVVHLDGRAEEVVHEVGDEVGVLEIGKDAKVHHYAEDSKRLSPSFFFEPMQTLGREEVIHNHKDQQGQEDSACLVIEKQRDCEKIGVAEKRLRMD